MGDLSNMMQIEHHKHSDKLIFDNPDMFRIGDFFKKISSENILYYRFIGIADSKRRKEKMLA